MKQGAEIAEDLDNLDTEEEIQEYLETLWRDAKQEAINYERLMFHYKWDSMSLNEIIDILENNNISEVEHK